MNAHNATTWLVVGGSPTAPFFFDAALSVADVTITCNSGWQLFLTAEPQRVPDWYWLSDTHACQLHGRAMRWMRRRGTKLITLNRSKAGLHVRGLDDPMPDVLVDAERVDGMPLYKPGPSFVHAGLSGLMCLQFAVKSAPRRIICVGMDGYKSSEQSLEIDNFDGRFGPSSGSHKNNELIEPFTQSVVGLCPKIDFIFCGKLRYRPFAPNVRIFHNDEDLKEWAQIKGRSNG